MKEYANLVNREGGLVQLYGEDNEPIGEDDLLSIKSMNEYMKQRRIVTNSATEALNALNTIQILSGEQIEALLKDYPELTYVIENLGTEADYTAEGNYSNRKCAASI